MITYEQEKNKKREQENGEYKNGWKPWRCTHTHTHTSLLKNNEINEFDIETTTKLSILC